MGKIGFDLVKDKQKEKKFSFSSILVFTKNKEVIPPYGRL